VEHGHGNDDVLLAGDLNDGIDFREVERFTIGLGNPGPAWGIGNRWQVDRRPAGDTAKAFPGKIARRSLAAIR
jgi:hypothetical protein